MKRLSYLLAASTLVLAACNTAPQSADTSMGAAATATGESPTARPSTPARPIDAAAVSAGQQVFATYCAVCHNGADDTAPQIDQLHTFQHERVTAALSEGGLMTLQSKALSPEQRAQVIAFITAPVDMGRGGTSTIMTAKEEYREGFAYPVRSARDPRDSSEVPRPPSWAAPKLGDGPFESESWEQRNLRTTIVTRGLEAPRAIEFLPNGDIFIVERAGTLRIVRNGKLDPKPIAGTPAVNANLGIATGFMDIALHPDFKNNSLVYMSYHKPRGDLGSNAIFRGKWDGKAIVEGKDIFVSDDVDTFYSKLKFDNKGKLYATIGGPALGTDASMMRAQKADDYGGKTLRLNDDGTAPTDNPFYGRKDANPEVFTMGHRISLGLTMNPSTNEMWATENAPYGGDEVNILRAGGNYGWPVSSEGRYYSGRSISPDPSQNGITRPHITYVPSIAPGGLVFYTGDKFPAWKGNLFVAAMRMGETPRTGHIERIVFNNKWEPIRNEMLLLDLHQRIRDVEQSPDGYLYAITDEGADSVLLKIEPGK
ncbi:MAG: PQQ-dependent sugar dehydrogenase [Hyphomonadaceae bacterium]|nr:PQQ-dependent sugar dehydrogenase [Hyphomonadaceae bacterium]